MYIDSVTARVSMNGVTFHHEIIDSKDRKGSQVHKKGEASDLGCFSLTSCGFDAVGCSRSPSSRLMEMSCCQRNVAFTTM